MQNNAPSDNNFTRHRKLRDQRSTLTHPGMQPALWAHVDARLDHLETIIASVTARDTSSENSRLATPRPAADADVPARSHYAEALQREAAERWMEATGVVNAGPAPVRGTGWRPAPTPAPREWRSGHHSVRERDVQLLQRLGFAADEAEHALRVAPADPVASRVECAVRWLCDNPRRAAQVGAGTSGSCTPAAHAYAATPSVAGLATPMPPTALPSYAPPRSSLGSFSATAAGALSPPPLADLPLDEERERRRLLAVLKSAPTDAILACLQSHLLQPAGPASSAAVSMLGALLPASQFPASWMSVVAGE